MLTVALISNDHQLHRLCREILSECLETSWDLCFPDANGSTAHSDVTIWDFCPDAPAPERLLAEEEHNNLFLVHRNHLGVFRQRFSSPGARILLKPVTHVTLSTFLEQCIADLQGSGPLEGRLAGAIRADRDELLQSLIRANLRLQEYDQDRTTFLTRAIHDFRAPLTALTGYCGLMLCEQLGAVNGDQKDVLERMHHSAKRLSRMATAMFQLGVCRHLDSGTPRLSAGDIRDCIEQALHELAHLITEKNLSISVDVEPPAGPVAFDSDNLEQVFVNLLDNACRFTPKCGFIELRGYPFFWDRRLTANGASIVPERRTIDSRGPNALRIDIRDSGPGIPAGRLDRIFEEYTSYSGGQDRSGGGLGLAICKLILGQHRGRIWAESSDAGAVFSFVLPLK